MELRLFSYELKHFNMAFMQIYTNSILNILNMDESGILWKCMKNWASYIYDMFKSDARLFSCE